MNATKNETTKKIQSHRSVRRYKPDAIPSDVLEDIFNCGIRSSTSGNMQSWSVILTEDPENKNHLYKLHWQQEMILQAPIVLTFCSDMHKMRRWVQQGQSRQSFDDFLGFMTGAIDAVIAAQSMAVAAESHGLGICYMGSTLWEADKISKALKLPEHVVPVTSMVMGYPNEEPEKRDRMGLSAMVHREAYTTWTDTDIESLFEEKAKATWERFQAWDNFDDLVKKYGIRNSTDYYTCDGKYSKALHQRVSEMYIQLLKTKKMFL